MLGDKVIIGWEGEDRKGNPKLRNSEFDQTHPSHHPLDGAAWQMTQEGHRAVRLSTLTATDVEVQQAPVIHGLVTRHVRRTPPPNIHKRLEHVYPPSLEVSETEPDMCQSHGQPTVRHLCVQVRIAKMLSSYALAREESQWRYRIFHPKDSRPMSVDMVPDLTTSCCGTS